MTSGLAEAEQELRRFPSSVVDEFNKAAEKLRPEISESDLVSWAQQGVEIARQTVRSWEAASEFFFTSPDVLKHLSAVQLKDWGHCGNALCRESPSLAVAFFRASPKSLAHLRPRFIQGWANLGVGVLYDDGGDDTYLAEEGAQGAASMGIALFMDASGNDEHRSFHASQGFAYVQAVGMVWDGGGDDVWYANPGKEEDGGTTLYYSPQLPSGGNSSFSQGAGFGLLTRGEPGDFGLLALETGYLPTPPPGAGWVEHN